MAADNTSFQFLRFLVVGGFSAAINLISGVVARRFGVTYGASIVIGFIVGTFSSYFFNRSYTFRSFEEHQIVQVLKFSCVTVISIGLAYVVGRATNAALTLGMPMKSSVVIEDIAHIFTIGIMTIFNFAGMKYFAFMRLGRNRQS